MSTTQCELISAWTIRTTSAEWGALAEYHRQRRENAVWTEEGAKAQDFKKEKDNPHLQEEAQQETEKEAVPSCFSVDATENKKFSRFDLRELRPHTRIHVFA